MKLMVTEFLIFIFQIFLRKWQQCLEFGMKTDWLPFVSSTLYTHFEFVLFICLHHLRFCAFTYTHTHIVFIPFSLCIQYIGFIFAFLFSNL